MGSETKGDNSRGTRPYVVVGVIAFVVGTLAVVGAILVGGDRPEGVPAAVSARGILIAIAAAALGVALLTPWRYRGYRLDQDVSALSPEGAVVGALVTADLKQDMKRLFNIAVGSWPTRVSLIGTSAALEVWSTPGPIRRLSIPWLDVHEVTLGRAYSVGRTFAALEVKLVAGSSFAVPLAPTGRLGIEELARDSQQEFLNRLRSLKLNAVT